MLPKILLAYLPELTNFAGILNIGITPLYQHNIISNSGVVQQLINVSGELFSSVLTQDLVGNYNVDLYHGSNYIGNGTVDLASASGYYIIDNPVGDDIDLSDVSRYPIETGNIQFNQEYATKSQVDSLQIKINQILDRLS